MSWRTLIEADLAGHLSDTELQRIRAAANGSQMDPIVSTLSGITDTVRGYISANPANVLGPDGTLPAELLDAACHIAVIHVWTRVGGGLIDPKGLRKEAADEALKLLRNDIATGRFRIRPPDIGALPPGVGPRSELVSARPNIAGPSGMKGLL